MRGATQWVTSRYWVRPFSDETEVLLRRADAEALVLLVKDDEDREGRYEAQLLSERPGTYVVESWALRSADIGVALDEARRLANRGVRDFQVREVMES